MDCKNFEGSDERQALFHGDQNNNMAYIQQAANAAITGAIGSSGYSSPPVSRKRKGPELWPSIKDPSVGKLAQQVKLDNIPVVQGFILTWKLFKMERTINPVVTAFDSHVVFSPLRVDNFSQLN